MKRIVSRAAGVCARATSALRPSALAYAAAPARSAAASACASIAPVRSVTICTAASTTPASAAASSSAPLEAPALGSPFKSGWRFVYMNSVRLDGRSKRFYTRVTVVEVPTTRGIEFGVLLDGRYIVSPLHHILSAPTSAAAHCIAFEWDSQAEYIRPVSMPLTNIAVTALDQAFYDRARFLTHFRSSMATDSVFLRTDAPSGLVAAQRKHWDPLLMFFRETYGCDLRTTQGIEMPTQSTEAVLIQRALLESLSGWQLAALDALTTVTKSFVVSWCLLVGRLSITQAFESARVEENFQMRQYGKVEGVYGHGIDMEFTRMSIAAAKTFANMVGPAPVPGQQLQQTTTEVHSSAAATSKKP